MSLPITETPVAPPRAESRNTQNSRNNTKITATGNSTSTTSRKSWFEKAAENVLGSSRTEQSPNENQSSQTESSINFSNPISSIHRNSSTNSLSLSSGLTPRQYSSINLSNITENTENYRNLEPVPDDDNNIVSTPQISDRTNSTSKSVSFRLLTPVTDTENPIDETLPQSESILSNNNNLSPIARENNQNNSNNLRLSQFNDTSAISLPPNMTMNETGQSERSIQLENYLRRLMAEREDLEEFLHKPDDDENK